jgi:hypothetical protein
MSLEKHPKRGGGGEGGETILKKKKSKKSKSLENFVCFFPIFGHLSFQKIKIQ